MKTIVHGATGHMGRCVLKLLSETPGCTLAAAVSPELTTDAARGAYNSLPEYQGPADLIIDFSFHGATHALLDYALSRQLPVVVCTTGQTEAEKAEIFAAAEKIPVFYSGNMSLGVALLVKLAKETARAFPDADIEIVETHHHRKLDAPSGTALMLADAIQSVRPQSTYHLGRAGSGQRTPEEIGIHAIRRGNVVGIHEILIDTGTETITLKHEAHDRALFAQGALRAAEYLVGKPAGLYNMQTMLGG